MVKSSVAAPTLSRDYLEAASNKTDLVKRLRTVHTALSEDEVEPNSPNFPSLDSLAAHLVTPKLLNHKDKDVRLYTSLCCMEIFYLYAPEPPWDGDEIIRVFEQIISQLSNLAHCHNTTQANYAMYFHILEQLAQVKIGVVLVELNRQGDANALEQLCELVRTLLTLVHADHPQEVMTNAVTAVAACVDEFDATIPTALLDELLICIARGPNPSTDLAEANVTPASTPSYMCAYNVIKRCEDRLSTPIANLINGLLNNDSRYTSETQISQDAVWGIVFEIHRIAPSLLTTVIGNVASALEVEEPERRLRVVKLLGRLFYAESSDVGSKFKSVFTQWSARVTDTDATIRKQMARCLVKILENKAELRDVATQSLIAMLSDPSSDIRIEVVHNVCDLASDDPKKVADELLREVGKRVSSKSKTERKDAATGLAQIYQAHYSKPKLAAIAADEDCNIDAIVVCSLNLEIDGATSAHEPLAWIPEVLFRALSYSDTDDVDMRSRVIQIVDDVLLPKSLSTTARACGISFIVSMLNDSDNENAKKWLSALLNERAKAQAQLNLYLETRERSRASKAGSDTYVILNAEAEGHLEKLVNEFVPFTIAGVNEAAKKSEIVQKIHNHKDNHIFTLLSSIADCTHSVTSRARALEDLPKRTMSLGTNAATWMKTLVRRCSMGPAMCFDTVNHCAMFAQESAREDEWPACALFLDVVKLGVTAFPDMGKGNAGEMYTTLTEFYGECRNLTAKSKKDSESSGIMSLLSDVLAIVAPAAATLPTAKLAKKAAADQAVKDDNFQEQLLKMCVKDGSPQEARNAVVVMASTVNGPNSGITEKEAFSPLLKALTAPQRLSVDNQRCVSVLSALAALAEVAPVAFEGGGGGSDEGRGVKAVRFALESVLLGKRGASILGSSDDVEMSDASDDEAPKQSAAAKATAAKKLATDRAVAAIELLVAHVKSLPALSKDEQANLQTLVVSGESDISRPQHTQLVFNTLLRIIEEKGIPPSTRDRKICTDAKSKASLRKAAGVGLLQMCDSGTKRDQFLGTRGWHILGQVLSDADASVRNACVEALTGLLLPQAPVYPAGTLPALRFLSMACLGADGEGMPGNVSVPNGGAANIGKTSTALRVAATESVKSMRVTCDTCMLQCKSRGTVGENMYEMKYKPLLMPEFSLSFAIHLLALRKETPKSKKASNDKGEIDGAYKMLYKRLKWLLEPLVSSVGDHAGNISFLMKITEQLGSSFDVRVPSSDSEDPVSDLNAEDIRARLSTVCAAARDVLLKFVKTDDNLAPYPGSIQVPGDHFMQREGMQGVKVKKMKTSDYAKEIKRAAAEADEYDDDAFDYGGNDDNFEQPSRHEESRDMPPMAEDSHDMIASPTAKPSRKTNWGVSPISSPAGKVGASPAKRRTSVMPKAAEIKTVNVSVNRSLSQSTTGSSPKKGTKRKSGGGASKKKTTKAQDESMDFDDVIDQENDAGNAAKSKKGKATKAKPVAKGKGMTAKA